jgi:hypothetical protein
MSNSQKGQQHNTPEKPSETQNAHDTEAGDRQPSETPNRATRIAKTSLKVGSRILAWDAIWKTSRLMRPKNPRFWSDVFSKKGYKAAKERFHYPRMHRPGLKVYASLSLSIGLSLLMALYSIAFITSHPSPAALPAINKIALAGCALYGVLGTAIYSAILVIKLKNQAHSAGKRTGAKQ